MSLSVMLAVAATLFVAADSKDEAVKKDLERLQGTWVVVGGEEKGDVFTREEAKREGRSLVVKGNSFNWFKRGREKEKATVRLDPTKRPAVLDFIYPGGQGETGNTNHAIYSLDGDRLTICVSRKFQPNRPEERPKKLTTKKGENGDLSGMVLLILERQK
jgi:uncharacterized protein (TIGR03067 family)